jgi:hypothetical protein
MAFSKSDLFYKDYVWTTKYSNDDPRVTGEPDKTLLARTEGWEMLYFVNKLVEIWNWSASVSNYQKIERAIRERVPGNERSQENIRIWIEQNLKPFWG